MKELVGRDTVSTVGAFAFAVAVGAFAYLFVTPERKNK